MVSNRGEVSLDKFPAEYNDGELVGITADGLAAYHTESTVFLAELDGDSIRTPPEGYSRWHALDLNAFNWELGDFILETAKDRGRWRELTKYGELELNRAGHNRIGVVE